VTQILTQKFSHAPRHAHRWLFQRFADTTEASVNRWADADFGHVANQAINGLI
jgi:hypothetical protein